MTLGLDRDSSKPSRRIISTSTASWSSPLALTRKASRFSVSSTPMLTLYSSSLSRRSLIWREVSSLPSRPARGEVFTEKTIDRVGSSTVMVGNGRDIASFDDLLADAIQALVGVNLAERGLAVHRAALEESHFLPRAYGATDQLADGDTADIVVVIQ